MAVTPTVARAGAAPAVAGRNSLNGPVAPVDPTPIVELDPKQALVNDGAGFRYEAYAGEDRARAGDGPFVERRARRIRMGLLDNSSEAFAVAFASQPQFAVPPGAPGRPNTQAAVRHGITTYEFTSAVIHNELSRRGESVSVNL